MAFAPKTPRPGRADPAVILAAAARLAPKVIAWMDETPTPVRKTVVTQDLAAAMTYLDDGYAIAKYLDDRKDYDADAALVEILDEAFELKRCARRAVMVAWAAAEGPTLDFAEGAFVQTPRGIGIVQNVYVETAEYLVAVTPEQRAERGCGFVFGAEWCDAVTERQDG